MTATDTPKCDAYRDSVSAVEITKHPLREFEELLNFARALERALTAAEAKCAELTTSLENLSQCELCEMDLITPNPDGSGHNCVCIVCWNKLHSRTERAEAELAECRLDALRYRWLRSWVPRMDEFEKLNMPCAKTESEFDAGIDAARAK